MNKWIERCKIFVLALCISAIIVQGQCIVWLAERIKVLEKLQEKP